MWAHPALRAAAGQTLRPGDFALTDRAAALAGLAPGWRVLDAGCGTGATVRRLRARHGARALGLDPDPLPADFGPGPAGTAPTADGPRPLHAPRPSGPPLLRADAQALPVRHGALDMVFCECVLSVLPDPDAALAEFARALRPGGVLALADLYVRAPDEPRAHTAPEAAGETAGTPETAEPHRPDLSATPFRSATPPRPAAPSCAHGAVAAETLLERVRAAGFTTTLFEDHTPLLRELAARLAWTGAGTAPWSGPCSGAPGSCSEQAPPGADGASCACSAPRTTLGYCLLLARKTEKDHA
ncbi:MAG: methyltransferase domain-containing protein [Desulfovibrionaceae bacterium]|nr:methyltransferase domain-containing protein [Desulfovibrionaceae bacterium]